LTVFQNSFTGTLGSDEVSKHHTTPQMCCYTTLWNNSTFNDWR